jgi:hypothetical protein
VSANEQLDKKKSQSEVANNDGMVPLERQKSAGKAAYSLYLKKVCLNKALELFSAPKLHYFVIECM